MYSEKSALRLFMALYLLVLLQIILVTVSCREDTPAQPFKFIEGTPVVHIGTGTKMCTIYACRAGTQCFVRYYSDDGMKVEWVWSHELLPLSGEEAVNVLQAEVPLQEDSNQ